MTTNNEYREAKIIADRLVDGWGMYGPMSQRMKHDAANAILDAEVRGLKRGRAENGLGPSTFDVVIHKEDIPIPSDDTTGKADGGTQTPSSAASGDEADYLKKYIRRADVSRKLRKHLEGIRGVDTQIMTAFELLEKLTRM